MASPHDSAQSPKSATVIIVGAGPVGLLTAIRLGRAGISTLVVESHESLLPTTRAVVYMPTVIPCLRKLGLFELIQENAYLNDEGVMWRNLEGDALAHLPIQSSKPGEFGGVLLIGQARMNALILEELKKCPSVEVRFGLKCVGIDDDLESDSVKVMVHTSHMVDTDITYEAKYVLGTDGANSSVRRMMCIPFEGFTYQNWKLIGVDMIYDFEKNMKFTPLNFVVHPDDFCVIAYTGEDEGGQKPGSGSPQWRMAYPEPNDLSRAPDEIMKRASKRIPRWIKGATDFKLLRAEPYVLHQRCAAKARKGRILLAGDALHSNNPMGGLGLTGGILDAFAYGNAFVRVINDGEPDSLLTECAESRRQAWLETTNGMSMGNLKRMYGFDEETVTAREVFFHKLNTDENFAKIVRSGFDKMMPKSFERPE